MLAASTGSADETSLRRLDWPEQGVLGAYDPLALKRGFQVYREVCSACHAMHLLSYGDLAALGYNANEIMAFAAEARVNDGPNDRGELFERPGRPSDHFRSPFPNEQAARFANGGAYPPDLSLIVKAREGHENYIHNLLTGYKAAPAGEPLAEGLYYNDAYPGHQIAMPPPLADGRVDFGKDANGIPVPDTVDAEARDVVQFLAWASEPHLEERHRLGVQVMIFLGVFAGLMYAANRRIWRGVH